MARARCVYLLPLRSWLPTMFGKAAHGWLQRANGRLHARLGRCQWPISPHVVLCLCLLRMVWMAAKKLWMAITPAGMELTGITLSASSKL